MNTAIKPKIETLEAALAEFSDYGKVETVRCENCHEVIEIVRKGESALSVKCGCGLYNDNLRGL